MDVESRKRKRPPDPRRPLRIGVTVAALATAAALAVLFAVPRSPAPRPKVVAVVETTRQTLSMGSRIATPADGTMSLNWNDATLRLNSGTRVVLQSADVAVLECGTVFVSSPRAGIIVQTPYGSVRDLGTQFEVHLAADVTRVRVRQGRVELNGIVAGPEKTLLADATGVRSAPAAAFEEWAWVERAAPPLRVDGMTAEDVLARVGQEKGLTLTWQANAATRLTRLDADKPLSVDQALDAACAATGMTRRVDADRLIIEPAP